jgi:O-acetyl-ADP-ribose deacetylase (regulator of RNase III)
LADVHGCQSIAFPAISTGIYGFPLEPACRIAVRTIRSFLAAPPIAVQRVMLVAFDDRTHRALGAAIDDSDVSVV